MLVKCDKCGQEYEVNESRISPQGARIKCPSCAHIFLVHTTSNSTPNPSDSSLPNIPVSKKEEAKEEVSWRVRHIGLTYTFHDLDSLREWLSGRNTLDDVKIAKDEDDWRELGDYPEVMTTELITRFFPLGDVPTSASKAEETDLSDATQNNGFIGLDNVRSASTTGMAMAAPVSISANLSNAVSSSSIKNQKAIKKQQARLEAEKKEVKKKWIGLVVLFLVLAIGAVVAMRFMRFGEFGIFSTNPEPSTTADTPVVNDAPAMPQAPAIDDEQPVADIPDIPSEPDVPVVSDEELRQLAEAELDKQYQEAAQMVKNRQWPEARATLESLIKQRPEHIETLQLLSKTYRGLSLNDKAADIDAQIKKLKAAAKKK